MRKRQPNGMELRGLSRSTSYRFDPDVARELEINARVRELSGLDYATSKDIVQEGLRLFFKKYPIAKEKRKAIETLMEL